MPTDETIPTALKAEQQWVCWRSEPRNGTPTKVPIDPTNGQYASVTDPTTWTDYETAIETYRDTEVNGLGFVFDQDGVYAGIDLDDCRDPGTGTVEEWVFDIVLRLNSYTEVSPSGTGYHILVEGTVPAEGNRNGNLEVYDRDRYFTITGDRVPGTPATVEQREEPLQEIYREYLVDAADGSETPAGERSVPVSDAELLEKAMNAANGAKFQRLWTGDTSAYPSHSEADQALCNLLAFWTGGDEQRIERLFSQSGLVREKWRAREDYRDRTIRTAVQDCPSYYEP